MGPTNSSEEKWQQLLSDMFNVFLSLAKEGANGALPIGSAKLFKSIFICACLKTITTKSSWLLPCTDNTEPKCDSLNRRF